MPVYKVLSPCFQGGKLYDPEGKRPMLYRDTPFPSVKKKEQVPVALKRMKDETLSEEQARMAQDMDTVEAVANKQVFDKKEIDAVTFVEPPKTNVETL